MRKFLRQKFWSLGTNLGSQGPGSQGDLGLGFNRLQFLVIYGPYECPELMACQGTAESLNEIAAWCDIGRTRRYSILKKEGYVCHQLLFSFECLL